MKSFDPFLVELVAATATKLERIAAEKRLDRVNERDHLQPAFVLTGRRLAALEHPSLTVSTQLKLVFAEWLRLGGVDATVRSDESTALIELKCGPGRDTLGPCVWDALKLSFARMRREASAAYLIAGAPASSWNKPIRGCEFLSTGEWDAGALRQSYGDWFRHWERLGDPTPTLLPKSFQTLGLGVFPFTVGVSDWELRLARVEGATDWIEWPTYLAPR